MDTFSRLGCCTNLAKPLRSVVMHNPTMIEMTTRMLIEVRVRLRETHLDCTTWRWLNYSYWRRLEGGRWRPSGAGLSGASGGPSPSPSGVVKVSGWLSSGLSGESRGSGLGSRFE